MALGILTIKEPFQPNLSKWSGYIFYSAKSSASDSSTYTDQTTLLCCLSFTLTGNFKSVMSVIADFSLALSLENVYFYNLLHSPLSLPSCFISHTLILFQQVFLFTSHFASHLVLMVTMHIPQQLVCPLEGDTVTTLPAPEILPSQGVPVQMTSSNLERDTEKTENLIICTR